MTITDFNKETDKSVLPTGSKLESLYLDPPVAYGRMRALFGEPNYETPDVEMAYLYLLWIQPESSRTVRLYVYQGNSGPAIGGQEDAESQQAARTLKKLLETSDAVADYQYEGYYQDAGTKIRMGIENGIPYFHEEPCEPPL